MSVKKVKYARKRIREGKGQQAYQEGERDGDRLTDRDTCTDIERQTHWQEEIENIY